MQPSPYLIHKWKTKKHHEMPGLHLHPHYEIYYLLSGCKQYFINGRSYKLNQGDIIFVNRFELHQTNNIQSDTDRILIYFQECFVRPALAAQSYEVLSILFQSQHCVLSLNVEQQAVVEQLLYAMLREQKEKPPGHELVIQSMLIQMMVYVSRLIVLYRKSQSNDEVSQPFDPNFERVSSILTYINEHYRENITLDLLTQQFFLSPYYISRMFHKLTGYSVVQYVNRVRITQAQRQLRESNDKITDICTQIGYSNSTHFGTMFRKYTGTTPSEYRSRYREPSNL
ncbi:AraC family transcriptional regulator [Paenibacillus oceani]|uniref:AraC family transcriptional regulator n=1 Tax=Paenibacillus oceani TaxID=2772510 RepID=A0A927CE81_9BACL|nr:AraC family transcriptional regulator [Paenibacillus oceani]MBD2865980.1 AraC family transcriptional regulator [Paenibacillus oceani]